MAWRFWALACKQVLKCDRVLAQAVQPKLEAMEAAWYRLHSISGAATPDQVITYWEGTALLPCSALFPYSHLTQNTQELSNCL